MIRYMCDMCKREIDPVSETRYQVKIEISAAFDPIEEDEPDDRDHLEEIHDLLERFEVHDAEAFEPAHVVLTFDLCSQCRKRFLRNPLGRGVVRVMGMSDN